MGNFLRRAKRDPSERMRDLRDAIERDAPLSTLLAAVDDPSPDIARTALRQIVYRRLTEAAPPLRDRLLEVEPGLTAELARTLAGLDDPRAARVAAGALIAGSPHRRIAAATALEILAGMPEVTGLLVATDDPLAAVRLRALRALTRIGAPRGGRRFELLLGDDNALVRAAAVDAVAVLDGGSTAALDALAEDPAPQVRQSLARHLRLLDRTAVERLLGDRHPAVRAAAAAEAGEGQAAALERMLDSDRVPAVRIAAARRLAEIGSAGGVGALIAALADPGVMVRAAAERALREAIDRDSVVDRLLDSLTEADGPLRRRIVYALGHLHATEAESVLAALAGDPEREVRLAVVHCGAQLFGAGWPPLLALAADPDGAVAHAATIVLEDRTPHPA